MYMIVPDLFAFAQAQPLPAALQRLGRSQYEPRGADWLEARLCRLFGLGYAPAAALQRLYEEADTSGYWLRADPVHLAIAQNSASVIDSKRLQLNSDECQRLRASLNQLLQENALEIEATQPGHWYLRLPQTPAARFLALPKVAGGAVPAEMVEGEDASTWKRLTTEMQMLLHEHPVNNEREARGLPTINHVWLWGAGTLPSNVQNIAAALWGSHPVLEGLGRIAGTPPRPVPISFERWRHSAEPKIAHLLVIDTLSEAAHAGDIDSWRANREELLDQWLQPALTARYQGKLPQMVLESFSHQGGVRFTIEAWDHYKFWKRPYGGH